MGGKWWIEGPTLHILHSSVLGHEAHHGGLLLISAGRHVGRVGGGLLSLGEDSMDRSCVMWMLPGDGWWFATSGWTVNSSYQMAC